LALNESPIRLFRWTLMSGAWTWCHARPSRNASRCSPPCSARLLVRWPGPCDGSNKRSAGPSRARPRNYVERATQHGRGFAARSTHRDLRRSTRGVGRHRPRHVSTRALGLGAGHRPRCHKWGSAPDRVERASASVWRWDRPAVANLAIASSAKDSLNLIPSPMFHVRIGPRRSTPAQWRRPAQIPSVTSRTCRSRPRRCRYGRYRRSSGPGTTGMAPSESASALAVTTPDSWWCRRAFRRCSKSGSPAPTPV
jgi:hypothetical protein